MIKSADPGDILLRFESYLCHSFVIYLTGKLLTCTSVSSFVKIGMNNDLFLIILDNLIIVVMRIK